MYYFDGITVRRDEIHGTSDMIDAEISRLDLIEQPFRFMLNPTDDQVRAMTDAQERIRQAKGEILSLAEAIRNN